MSDQIRQGCRISSINGLKNDSRTTQSTGLGGGSSAAKEDPAEILVADWYSRLRRPRPAKSDDLARVSQLLRRFPIASVRRALDWSIAYVLSEWADCRALGGVLGRVEERLARESADESARARQAEQAASEQRRAEEAWSADQEKQRLMRAHWLSLPESEREARMEVCRRRSWLCEANAWACEGQAQAEAWSDYLSSSKG